MERPALSVYTDVVVCFGGFAQFRHVRNDPTRELLDLEFIIPPARSLRISRDMKHWEEVPIGDLRITQRFERVFRAAGRLPAVYLYEHATPADRDRAIAERFR
jgi:hypothetical protein